MASDFGEDRLPRAIAEIVRGIEAGWHRGAQVYVALAGEPVAELAIGESRPGVAITRDTLMLWLSSSKPIGAAAILQLVERGLLGLDDLVAQHIPEFGVRGKEATTVRHLLTHTCGFRWIDLAWETSGWDEIIAKICAGKQERDWAPGTKAGYHPGTSWYILGELVRRLDGRPYSEYVREEILMPLGMVDSWIGMPADQYRAYGDRLALMPETDKPDQPLNRLAGERGATECVPGANGYGPVRELGRFYEMLLAGGVARSDGAAPRRLLSPTSVELMTTAQRIGMYDQTFRHTMDWSLGLLTDSNRYGADTVPYGYGPYSSPRAYGHSGSQSSAALADPEHGLVAVTVMNGMPGELAHQRRMRAYHAALYRDLGIA